WPGGPSGSRPSPSASPTGSTPPCGSEPPRSARATMRHMRAVVWEGPDVPMQVEEVPDPRPGPGEVLVRVAATGVCHSDLHVMKGEVAFPGPGVLGHEISGH